MTTPCAKTKRRQPRSTTARAAEPDEGPLDDPETEEPHGVPQDDAT